MLSRITPMKRVLCLCPVAKSGKSGSKVMVDVGMAVSDPYLAHAIPVRVSSKKSLGKIMRIEPFTTSVCSFQSLGNIAGEEWPGNAKLRSVQYWDRLCGYSDIGAVAFALPMMSSRFSDDTVLRKIREELKVVIKDSYNSRVVGSSPDSSTKSFLQCDIDDRLTEKDATKKSEEEPSMWEEIEYFMNKDKLSLQASTHASVALNEFLWRHTGGWPNTFG